MDEPTTQAPARDRDPSWAGVLRALCAHHADTADRLTAHLEAHPADVTAWCLRGFAQLLLGRADRRADAAAALATARAVSPPVASRRDAALVSALEAWCHDRPVAAVDAFDQALAEDPRDLLAMKVQHTLLLMLGQPARMRQSLERVLPDWPEPSPGRGFVLGCFAFSLEETGEFARAEAMGREAVARQPDDAWAIHAVAHVCESLGRAREGVTWLAAHAGGYARCNVFRGHVHWHRALLHFQLEEFAQALEVYDQHVATPWAGDYRDMSNAVSLLWRLESEGVDVGRRWQRLAEIAAAHAADRGSAFALAHYAVALGRGGAPTTLPAVVAALSGPATADAVADSQDAVVREVGRPLCQGIEALCAGNAGAAYERLAAVAPALPRIGGSDAQRDLFTLMLIDTALAAGRFEAVRRLVEARQQLRPGDPWLVKRAAAARAGTRAARAGA